MTHWLSRIPCLPTWSGWPTVSHAAKEAFPW